MNVSKEKEIAIWQARLAAADAIIANELQPIWDERVDNWRGEQWVDEGQVTGHRPVVNMTRGIVDLMIAALYFSDPRVQVAAKKPNLGVRPKFAESLFNYYLDELDVAPQIERAIADALLCDLGYIKTGYEIDLGTDLESLKDDNDQELYDGQGRLLLTDSKGNLYVEKDGRYVQMMEADGELVMQEQEQPTLNEFIRREQPFAVRIDPRDVLRDPRGRYADLSDSRWIAFRSVVPLEEVKGNPIYSHTRDLEGNLTVRDGELFMRDMYDPDRADPDIECVEIFEIWCKEWNKAKKRYDIYQKVVAKDYDKFLLHRLSPYMADGFPCEVLAFGEDPRKPYGSSPLRAIDSQMESLNISRAQMADAQDQQLQKWVANGQFISQEEFEAFMHAPSGGGIRLANVPPDIPVTNLITAIPIPQMSPDIRMSYDLARDEIQVVFGVTDYQMGGSGGPKRQATEAGLIQSGFTVRVEKKRQAVGKIVNGIVRNWAMYLRQFGDYETAVKITNDIGQEEWVQFKIAEAVTDELSFHIDVYQSIFQSREVQQKQAMDRYNLLRNDQLINPARLIEDVVRSYGEQDPNAYMAQQQPMMPPMGMEGGPPQLTSIAAGGQAVDTNQLREPAPVGAGSTGRALG